MVSSIDLSSQTNDLEFYSFLIMIPVGLITNALNIVVSTRKNLKKTTMGFYNIVFSFFNILSISGIFLQVFPPTVGLNDLLLSSDLACRLLPYLNRLFAQLALCINSIVCFDRLLLMSYQNLTAYNNRFLNTKKKTRIIKILLIMVAVLMVINSPGLLFHLETNKVIMNNQTNETSITTECKSTPLLSMIRDVVAGLFRVVFPIIIQTVISFILIYKLSRLKINVTTLSLKREYKFTFTMIILNITFIVSEVLIFLGLVFINIYGYNQTYKSTSTNASAIASFFYACSIMFGTFISTNLLFFINLITNMKFQREAKRIFTLNFK